MSSATSMVRAMRFSDSEVIPLPRIYLVCESQLMEDDMKTGLKLALAISRGKSKQLLWWERAAQIIASGPLSRTKMP
jgi:hypothetical protein